MADNDLPVFEFDIGDIPTTEKSVETEVQEQVDVDTTQPEEVEGQPEDNFAAEAVFAQSDEPEDTGAVEDEPEDAAYYKSLLGFWKDEGLLDYDGEFNGTKEQFAEILKNQRLQEQEMVQTGIIEAMPDYAKGLVEYILTEGEALSHSKLKEFLDIGEQQSSIPTVDTEESAKAYLLDKFSKVHNQSMAEKFVEALEDDGNLVETAQAELDKDKARLAELEKKKIEESKQTKAQREAAAAKFQENLTAELRNTGWNKEIQQQVYADIFNGELKRKTAELVNYPKALAKVTNYLRFLDPKTGDIDESAFAKTAFSGAAKSLKDTIEKHFSRSDAFASGGSVRQNKKDKNETFVFAE